MYDQGDKEDREIAENQRREAQLREELPEGEEPGDPRDILTPGEDEKLLQGLPTARHTVFHPGSFTLCP